MKYNQELHELTNELDDCYKDIFHSSNLGNTYNFNLGRSSELPYTTNRENQSGTGLSDIDNKNLGENAKDLKSNMVMKSMNLKIF